MTMPREGLASLSIIVQSGEFERVHYALVMASAAVATNRKATLFFTGGAVQALVDWRKLQGAARDGDLRARGIGGFAELLSACVELGVRMIACEAGLRAADIAAAALDPALKVEIVGIVTLYNGVEGQLIFV
jgi:predicted peroxiredoxin